VLRPYRAVLLLLLSSCKSSEPTDQQSLAAIQPMFAVKEAESAAVPPEPSRDIRCKESDTPACPEDHHLPFRCIAYRYDGKLLDNKDQVISWGENPCEAKRNLHVQACANQLNPDQLDSVSCSPDSSNGKCPRVVKKCPSKVNPTRCFAQVYRDQDLDWSSRPQAWGKNECEARQNLEITACRNGLEQEEFGRILCEAEPTPALCPPQLQTCGKAEEIPAQCSLGSLGGRPLQKSLKTIGTSLCEARYRMQILACRMGSAANHLTPEDLGSMACLGLDGSVTAPALTN
jgi:hypothetical protein